MGRDDLPRAAPASWTRRVIFRVGGDLELLAADLAQQPRRLADRLVAHQPVVAADHSQRSLRVAGDLDQHVVPRLLVVPVRRPVSRADVRNRRPAPPAAVRPPPGRVP